MGLYQKGQNWYIDYYVSGSRRREMIGPSRKLALEVLQKRRVQIAENKFLEIKKEDRIKFKDFAETFLENHSKQNKKSWRSTDQGLVKSLASHFGDLCLHEITPLAIERYKLERRKKVSFATVNRSLSCLRCMFNRAIAWDMARENPIKKVKFFKEDNGRLRFLEKVEMARLLSHCDCKLRAIVLVALNTGMRKGEIANLRWKDIDFQRGIITLLRTKNGEKRYIPLNSMCRAALQTVEKHPHSEHIFCNSDGNPYNFRKSFETALKRAGIISFRFHDLRHTFASHLMMSGVDLNTVRDLLGHKDISLTLRYAHLSPDHKARALENFAHQMDTIWPPSENGHPGDSKSNIIKFVKKDSYSGDAHVAQLVEQRFRKP